MGTPQSRPHPTPSVVSSVSSSGLRVAVQGAGGTWGRAHARCQASPGDAGPAVRRACSQVPHVKRGGAALLPPLQEHVTKPREAELGLCHRPRSGAGDCSCENGGGEGGSGGFAREKGVGWRARVAHQGKLRDTTSAGPARNEKACSDNRRWCPTHATASACEQTPNHNIDPGQCCHAFPHLLAGRCWLHQPQPRAGCPPTPPADALKAAQRQRLPRPAPTSRDQARPRQRRQLRLLGTDPPQTPSAA